MQWREIIEILGERPYLATFNLDPLHGAAIASLSLPTTRPHARLPSRRRHPAGDSPGTPSSPTPTSPCSPEWSRRCSPSSPRASRGCRAVSATLVSQESTVQFVQFAGRERDVPRRDVPARHRPTTLPSQMTFALPFALVRQITESMRSGSLAREGASRLVDEPTVLQRRCRALARDPARSSSRRARSHEIKVGDVIRFHHPLRQPLDLRAEGVLVAARPARRRRLKDRLFDPRGGQLLMTVDAVVDPRRRERGRPRRRPLVAKAGTPS